MNKTIHSVYLQFDKDNSLIYVGFTGRGMDRQDEHRKDKPWWAQVARTEWLHFGEHRDRALAMEEWLIRMFRPVHNIQHNQGPLSDDQVEFLRLIGIKRDRGIPLRASEQRQLNAYEKRSPLRAKCDRLIEELS